MSISLKHVCTKPVPPHLVREDYGQTQIVGSEGDAKRGVVEWSKVRRGWVHSELDAAWMIKHRSPGQSRRSRCSRIKLLCLPLLETVLATIVICEACQLLRSVYINMLVCGPLTARTTWLAPRLGERPLLTGLATLYLRINITPSILVQMSSVIVSSSENAI